MNIYEMYVEHGRRPGFWVRRTTWGTTIAKVIEVGELHGPGPYFGNPTVVATVYDFESGEVKDERFVIGSAGTFKTWRWVQPPEWSGEKPFDPQAGRVLLHVPFEENRKASRLGAKWSELLGAWWVAEDNAKALAKAGELGYLNPPAPLVYFKVPYEEREVAKAAGAKWVPGEKAWAVPEDDAKAMAAMADAGFSLRE
ncbi:hypothetical protein R2571_006806 [Pseudomonas aeruginosa]|nr:hypothetical protein [Pseudomonas aeruginosa]